MKHCSRCAVEYADDVVFCPHCGDKLIDGNLQYTCPNCGQLLGTSFEKFCPHCGQQFNVETNNHDTQTSSEATSSKRNLIIAISVIAVLVGGYFGFKKELINTGIVSPSTAEEHYEYGQYLEKKGDLTLCYHQMTLAADKGHIEALYRVGITEMQNENYSKGLKYLLEADSKGHKEAAFYLGVSYYLGDTVEKDASKSVMFYEKAAGYGNFDAAYYAGEMYLLGRGNLERNVDKAIPLLEKVANNPKAKYFADSQVWLGKIYYMPKLKHIDIKKSIYWFTKAYENGKLSPIVYLETIYNDDPVYKDYGKALKWHKIGAQKSIEYSMMNLSIAYYLGRGVPVDYDAHIYWGEKADKAVYKTKDIIDKNL